MKGTRIETAHYCPTGTQTNNLETTISCCNTVIVYHYYTDLFNKCLRQ